ncbi:MAG: hypothetical protein KGJ48_18335, partial [Nitrospirota bacterium]|nr:hypothetical protein [Nitrospirota bacterium]
ANQWACLEYRITMNMPGLANGILQTWVNGAAGMNVTNGQWRGTALNGINGPSSNIQTTQFYVQHGWGTIYYDDYAVSRDARIGCSGSAPTADTTPPAPPVGLVIR